MEKTNPKVQRKGTRRRVSVADNKRNEVLQNLRTAATRGDENARKEYLRRTEKNLKSQAERETQKNRADAGEMSQGIRHNDTTSTWRHRKTILSEFRSKLPKAFTDGERIIYRKAEVLDFVKRQVHMMCEPGTRYMLGIPDEKRWDKIAKRHSRLRQIAKESRDLVIDEEDMKAVMKYARKCASRSQSCAKSGLNAAMLTKAGWRGEESIRTALSLVQKCGTIPTRWSLLLITLLLKPEMPSEIIESYRAVVQAEFLSKCMEKVIANKLHACKIDIRGNARLNPAIMAYTRGISTGMAIFVVREAPMEAQLDGVQVDILGNDVKWAYNTTDRKGVEVTEWDELKFQGQAWELARQLAGPVRHRTKVHGHLTEETKQNEGYAQGKILSCDHFNVSMHTWITMLEKRGVGIKVGGRLITGVVSSDDSYIFTPTEQIGRTCKAAEECMTDNKKQANIKKQYVLQTGRTRTATQWNIPTTEGDEWYCTWQGQHPEAKFGRSPITVKHSAKVLGTLVGPHTQRHPKQAEWARKKGISALKFIGWMGAFTDGADTNIAKLLVTYLVNSVIVAAVLTTELTEKDYIELRKPQVEAARRATGAGKRVSQLALLRELNWGPVDAPIWSCKIGLHEAMKRLPSTTSISTVLGARMRSIQTGRDERGLCAETKKLWTKLGSPESWTDTKRETKAARKRRLRPLIAKAVDTMWEEWCDEFGELNGDYQLLCPQMGEEAEHISNGTKKQVGLMITARAGACTCRGNKTANSNNVEEKKCQHCTLGQFEDETHMIVECKAYQEPRSRMLAEVHRNMTEEQKQELEDSDPRFQKLILLGMKIEGDTEQMRRARDTAMKIFLEEINTIRKEQLGETDLCGKAPTPTEGSAEEAYEWTQEARKASETIGEDMVDWKEDEAKSTERSIMLEEHDQNE